MEPIPPAYATWRNQFLGIDSRGSLTFTNSDSGIPGRMYALYSLYDLVSAAVQWFDAVYNADIEYIKKHPKNINKVGYKILLSSSYEHGRSLD
jgi:hypothetical protein